MRRSAGLNKYLYEYIFHQAIDQARDTSGQVIPISQAKAIRRGIDERLGARLDARNSERAAEQRRSHPGLVEFLTEVDSSIVSAVEGAEPLFEGEEGQRRSKGLQDDFVAMTGLSGRRGPGLPISPYDPQWSERATIKRAGTALSFITDADIDKIADGRVERISEPGAGMAMLWARDDDGEMSETGPAMTDEDASGLSALMDAMSEREYAQVRNWVLDGGRDPRTNTIDRNRFMSPAATARAVALLQELRDQGLDYEVVRDQHPGQIKAKVAGTSMEIRLTDRREKDDYVGRIYDNGLITRFSVTHDRRAVHSATPEEAVDLLRFAQGRPVGRRDSDKQVGELGQHTETRGYGNRAQSQMVTDSYYSGRGDKLERSGMFAYGDVPNTDGAKIYIRREAANRTLPEMFVRAEAAEDYLGEAVASSRQNLAARLDVDALLEAYDQQRAEALIDADGVSTVDLEMPELSNDDEVAAIQRSYWDVLTGRRADLLRPGATQEMYDERLGQIGELSGDEAEVMDLGNLVYGGSAEEKVRAHAQDVVEELVGTYEPETHHIDGEFIDQRFDPIRVARYMTSEKGDWSNMDDLAAACRRLEIPAEEMMGTGFQASRFKDRLIGFDEATAVPMAEHPSPFIQQMGAVTAASIERSAAVPDQIRIDENGVINWSAEKVGRDGQRVPVSGQIGQIFDLGDRGEVVTRFASGENSLVVPGYEARIRAQRPGETKSVEERTLLRGYSQMMADRIEHQIAGDTVIGRSQVGDPTSLNSVYSRLYGTRHPVDFIEQARLKDIEPSEPEHRELNAIFGAPDLDPWTDSILATEARRVRYTNDVRAGSTVYAQYQAERQGKDPADDNHFDAWQLTGGRNMVMLTGTDAAGVRAPEGYFDPVMTGGAINQGVVRYLTADAEVSPDGSIVAGDPTTLTGSRTPLMTRPELETLRYDPFDRQQMTASTIMQSSSVTTPTSTAMMTFGGWGADDGIVVSSDFAQQHRIRGAGGQLRDLVVGDKLSDLHGNKGVISLIVDREMPLDEVEAQGLAQEVAWFQANPEMDVVMSPFSLISRRNAGAARELMGDQADSLLDVKRPDASKAAVNGLGQMRFVVTHMAVDEKTKVYDDEAMLSGRGRKASSQLAWALGAQDCPAIMTEFYGSNTAAEANLREHMLSVGLDMEADGTMRVVGRETDENGLSHEAIDDRPERRLIEMPELLHNSRGGLALSTMVSQFGDLVGDRGGDLELPFPLTNPTGEQTERVSANSWKMPVLSSHLRAGQSFDDGTVYNHDYTNRYLDIFREACRYRSWAEQLTGEDVDAGKRAKLTENMSRASLAAQRKFEAINADLAARVFSGKQNHFKTGLMSSRLPDSATAVWTADPRLDIDQVAMNPVMAEELGLAEGDHALIWRDPVLRDAGVRYLRVALDDRLTGVAINPVMDACFDGDFDGDAVAVVKLHSQAAKGEAMAKLSVPANLLDTGVVAQGQHPLAMQRSLDTQVALSKDSGLTDEFDSAVAEVNRLEQIVAKQEPDSQDLRMARLDLTDELTDLYRRAQRHEFGSALSFEDPATHLDSIRAVCLETGAKGSEQNLDIYGRYLGDAEGDSGITQADQEASMFATAIRAHGTGLGGGFSQRAVRALRNTAPKAVNEVTYPVTQSILQAKHDASEAEAKYEALQGPGRDLWRGRLLEHQGRGQWNTVFEDGEPVQATVEEWRSQFIDFYTADDGFNVSVNPEYVDQVAAGLADPKTQLMRNLEEDPALAGTLLDRMAYGGNLSELIEAAGQHENLFDGEHNQRFASMPTRRARERAQQQLEGYDPSLDEVGIEDTMLKRDVLVDDHERATARGAGRRSAAAVSVGKEEQKRMPYTPSIEIDQTEPGVDYGMGE